MDAKIQELTNKIYREGVEKGNEEAERIIAEAKAKENLLIQKAEEKAQQILADAEKKAAELKKNTESELKMFAVQSVEALKSEVTNLINGKIIESNVKAATVDTDFIKKMILEIAKEWVKKEDIIIQAAEDDLLIKYFESNAKDLLKKGVVIQNVNGHVASFSIGPSDGSYKVSFGENEFIAYFKDFLRPQLVEMLFK